MRQEEGIEIVICDFGIYSVREKSLTLQEFIKLTFLMPKTKFRIIEIIDAPAQVSDSITTS
jgi:hypothetical protein